MLAKERRMDETELATYSEASLGMYMLLKKKILWWQASANATVNVCGPIYQKALLVHLRHSIDTISRPISPSTLTMPWTRCLASGRILTTIAYVHNYLLATGGLRMLCHPGMASESN